MIEAMRKRLSTVERVDHIDAVAIGSPHLSITEFDRLERAIAERKLAVPLYACTGRHALVELEKNGRRQALEKAGVVTSRYMRGGNAHLPAKDDAVLMTNSGKFAHYAPGNTGYGVLYGSLEECVESAVAGRPVSESRQHECGKEFCARCGQGR
jgi:predicted aconitase